MSDQHKIGVTTATIIGMNAMIGSGIFTAPAAMAAYVGPAGILAYVFVVMAVWFMAQSIARLAQLYPHEGSFYLYAKQWGGHYIGLFAVTSYFIGLLIAMGLLSQMAGTYLHVFFPSVSAETLGLVALFLLVVLNMFGVALSSLGQHILIICTVFPLIATTIMCLTKFNISYLTPFAPYGFAHVLKATRIVIFGFFGFEAASSLFNIVKQPEKNVPKALTYSILIVGTLYIFFVGSIILSTPLNLFSDPRTPLSQALAFTFPNQTWLLMIINFAILSAIVGTVHSMIWSSSHLLTFIFAKIKGSSVAAVGQSTFFNSRISVLYVGLCIFASYTLLKNPDLFFCLTAVFLILAFIFAMITLLTLPAEWKSGQNIKTLLGIATALTIFIFAAQGIVEEVGKLI